MKTIINREDILGPLQNVIGAVERRQTLPILGNILLRSSNGVLTITATDLEIEMVAQVKTSETDSFETTIPARKLLDICKALPDGCSIQFDIEENKVTLHSGRSRFTLASLPANEFPGLDDIDPQQSFNIPQKHLKDLFDSTAFAMAQQDVRYYLNGMLVELSTDNIKLVATDGHRLALSEYPTDIGISTDKQIIIPRKGVMELSRLLENSDSPAEITLSKNHIRIKTDAFTFTSKLIDGKFPEYKRVIPVDGNRIIEVSREALKQTLNRIAILSNEKYRGVRLILSTNNLSIQANNPDQEEAEEELTVEYEDAEMEIGFNVTYLIDVLNVLECEKVLVKLKDANSSCIISDNNESNSVYVVMPMRL